MNISAFSTKALIGDSTEYRFRDKDDISRFVWYVMHGNQKEQPLVMGSIGFPDNTDSETITGDMIDVQNLYRKTSGIRIRGEVVEIYKYELSADMIIQRMQIRSIAFRFCEYFFWGGFQAVYGIFEYADCYRIIYAINPVSYGDGSKYRHNNNDVYEDQMRCLNAISANVTGRPCANDYCFESLEYK